MQLATDPSIATKIRKMKQRVRWQDAPIRERGIDQTRLVIDDDNGDAADFSFLVIGDSGTGYHHGYSPQRRVAELLLEYGDRSRFLLHTGDVIYYVGSSEYYNSNFIAPYREFIVGGEEPDRVAFDRMVFRLPMFPVLGNHDYYDLLPIYGFLAQLLWLPRHLIGNTKVNINIGWHGSYQGQAYAKAFLDYLQRFENPEALKQHLDRHYIAKTNTGRCLSYRPGEFTRLPNRYYSFRYGGIDFFALDSNTFNAPVPIPDNLEGEILRRRLERRLEELEREKEQLMDETGKLNPNRPQEAQIIDDNNAKLDQIDEIQLDIQKKLAADEKVVLDLEQLEWLEERLIGSWNSAGVRGRIIFLHHPPYVTEATKWEQAQTMQVRYQLRKVLDAVAAKVDKHRTRPLVDIVFSGHAHCFEHLQTVDTGHGDAGINWIICGGSGHSLRRQRREGGDLYETFGGKESRLVARSHRFIGRHGHGNQKRRCYSGLRVDVSSGERPQYRLLPLVTERVDGGWNFPQPEAFTIG